MGICISMEISKATTKEEWNKVYNETLELIKYLPLADTRKVDVHGIECFCLTPTTERKEEPRWRDEPVQYGWAAVGDYESMRTAEEYYLSRNLIEENIVDVTNQDAIWGVIPEYLDYDWNDRRCNQTYSIWGAKTQGEPYHIYLLAVAVLIEARLGIKAFTYGDITRGQLKKAVEIVNEFVEDKIDLPERCYIDKLYDRVMSFEVDEDEKMKIIDAFYLGEKDTNYGEFLCSHFQSDVRTKYWKRRFAKYDVNMLGFDDVLRDYLEWGFELEELGKYLDLEDKDEKSRYNTLINKIMKTELQNEHKDCEDVLRIDQNREEPYNVSILFAQFLLAGAKNSRMDRYIPLDELRIQLERAFGDKCDVNGLINEYLKKEQDITENKNPSIMLNQAMDERFKVETEMREKYNICDYEDLRYYEDGDTVHPQLAKSVGASRKFLDSIVDEKRFEKLMSQDAKSKCKWVVEHNKYILIRDIDWDKVFNDIENNPDSFARYYSLMRAKVNSQQLNDLSIALFLNDDFYALSAELAREVDEETTNN